MTTLKKNLLLSLAIIILLALTAAPSPDGSESQIGRNQDSQNRKTENYNPIYNDYARFIAGLPNPGSTLVSYENEAAWIQYAAYMDRSWESFQKRQLTPMTEWVSQELRAVKTSTVFYPFSGPDFLNVYTLFPEATTYLMVGLEPIGGIPDFSANNIPDFFANLQQALYQYLYIDYFVTARMKTQIAHTDLEGVLPVLLFFMARQHARVLDVRYLALTSDGTLQEQEALQGEKPGPGIPGVRVVFTTAGSPAKRTLYYFRFNLQNSFWERNLQFASFLKSLGPLTTFTKSASYLLFSRYSSDLRQFILDRSQYVLQDDSGIPLKDFAPNIWNLKFFGKYVGPISLFSDRYQADLAEVYNRGQDVYPLPFGIGYQFRPGTSNLILASKK